MKRFWRRIANSTAALAVLGICSDAARAEAFFDLRAGASFTEDGDTEVSALGVSLSGESEFEDAVTVGGRGGYWFESLPWIGLAIDASYFAPDLERGGPDLDVVPVSPLLMLRAPLFEDEEYSHGRLQPFLGIGPGIFITILDEAGYSDTTADVGVDLHAGLKFLVTSSIGIFVQYRYTSYEAQASDDIGGVSVDTDIDLDTHHVAGGVGLTF
jgi:hypothetical protein